MFNETNFVNCNSPNVYANVFEVAKTEISLFKDFKTPTAYTDINDRVCFFRFCQLH